MLLKWSMRKSPFQVCNFQEENVREVYVLIEYAIYGNRILLQV
jgi:hypothetical protein